MPGAPVLVTTDYPGLIVSSLTHDGGKAVGLSGKDANLMICEQTHPDLGFVGTPVEMNPDYLRSLAAAEIIPVIAPIGMGGNGAAIAARAWCAMRW